MNVSKHILLYCYQWHGEYLVKIWARGICIFRIFIKANCNFKKSQLIHLNMKCQNPLKKYQNVLKCISIFNKQYTIMQFCGYQVNSIKKKWSYFSNFNWNYCGKLNFLFFFKLILIFVDWFCLFTYLWVLTFPLEDCSEFGKFVITLICIQ